MKGVSSLTAFLVCELTISQESSSSSPLHWAVALAPVLPACNAKLQLKVAGAEPSV